VFPRQIHANITPDTHVIITVSNDAWFGDSHGPHQHMQIAQMRALEFGLPVLRVTNNGITGIIDHRGRIQSQLPQFESGMLIDEVTINTNNTLYRRFGDIINVIICFFWMAIYIGLSMVTRNI
jgi:apolipoprotein N-acyltransferase